MNGWKVFGWTLLGIGTLIAYYQYQSGEEFRIGAYVPSLVAGGVGFVAIKFS